MKIRNQNSFSHHSLIYLILFSPICCLAESDNHIELQAQGGISFLSFEGPYEISPAKETDTLVQTNNEDAFQGSVGVGYVFVLNDDEDDEITWFRDAKLALNFYGFEGDNNGDAWQFGQADLNNFTYSLGVNSWRLMLDAYLTIIAWEDFSLFALVGTGESWNRIKYSQTPNEGIPGVEVTFNDHTDTNWAFETGAGLDYAITNEFSVSLSYLYTHLNHLETSGEGQIGDNDVEISPLTFDLHTNTIFLGLNLAI
jgi:opacity protein-like surface antigen